LFPLQQLFAWSAQRVMFDFSFKPSRTGSSVFEVDE
jgi:hypothetical protein